MTRARRLLSSAITAVLGVGGRRNGSWSAAAAGMRPFGGTTRAVVHYCRDRATYWYIGQACRSGLPRFAQHRSGLLRRVAARRTNPRRKATGRRSKKKESGAVERRRGKEGGKNCLLRILNLVSLDGPGKQVRKPSWHLEEQHEGRGVSYWMSAR